MIIKVKKNKHLSNEITKPILFGDGSLKVKVKFTFDSMYDVGEDQLDWNKLCGKSWGFLPLIKQFMMHENSSRFGCRLNLKTGCYQVTPYFYNKGKRYYAENLKIKPTNLDWYVDYILQIIPDIKRNKVAYLVKEEKTDKLLSYYVATQNIPSLKGWLAPFYFGGNKPANKEIKLFKNYIK